MKKQLLLAVSFIISTVTIAQLKKATLKTAAKQPSFGVRAGLISSNLTGDAVNSLQGILNYSNGMVSSASRTGFFAGTYATIPIDNLLSVEPGIYYSQRGYELNGQLNLKGAEFAGVNAKAKLNADYLDVPLLLKATIDGLQLFAGPQISYLMKADLQTTAGLLGFNLLNTNMDATSQFNRLDVGVTAGIGYRVANGFNIMAAYDHGLSKMDANRNLDSYNRSFKFGVGLNF